MKNTRLCLYAAGAIVCAAAAFTTAAAEATATTRAPTITEEPARPPYHPWTIGFEGGSQGLLGGFVSWRFSDHLGTRFAGDYSSISHSDTVIKSISYDARLRLLVEPLTLDVYPWQKSSFHFCLGIVFNQNELTGTANDAGNIIIGGQPLNGTLSLKIRQQPVNPYASIAGNFFYFDRAHHWAVGGELGVAYAGESKVTLTRTGAGNGPLLGATEAGIKKFADQFSWWPVAKLYLSFSF